ncbi:hypothetical protein ST47_g10591 [Ascochyta rabiei]|uniref:Uncharacterized protein n=1 Tax=Didymella rabiei TaxID=5454 RepID=A0A162V776_DIDRA|nr:hypothetical protein ST47_g10591 [Ascochyta rabiei]
MQHFLLRPYATNFLRYRQLLHYTDQRNFTRADIEQVKAQAMSSVHEYEDLYYMGNPDLLPSCTIQYHYLLHLGQNIQDFGPPSCYAQWLLERFLRTVKRFSTATAYKHRSAEVNSLIREQRIHAKWSCPEHWAGVARYRKVQPASTEHYLPQPRMFDEDNNDIIWISVDRVVDLVGAAQVYYRRGTSIIKALFLVDKYGRSEVDTPQQAADIGRDLALIY